MKFTRIIQQVSILIFLLFAGTSSFAQINTIGREFIFGFMDNNRRDTQPDRVVVIITANEKTSGIVQTPKQSIPFALEAGEQLIREFDGDSEAAIHRESGKVEYRPFKISSSGDITVHAINGREYSTDGTVILPISALSSEYLVTAHYDVFAPEQDPGSNQNFESTLLVVATENDTEVEVTPSARTVNTIPAGSRIRFTLNAGESYQIKADGDLTGSRVKVVNGGGDSCKLLAVFGGNKTSSAGDCGTTGDHIFQQAYPLESWGKTYIHIPLKGRTSGEIVKVLASEDNTEVSINGVLQGTVNTGRFLRFEFGKNETAVIETNKPVSVSVTSKSGYCNEFGVASLGDPSIFTLSPNEQRLKSIMFSTGKLIGAFNQNIEHFLTILVPRRAEEETLLNGQNIGSEFSPVPGTDFSYARVKVNFGVNSLSNPEGFIGYVYGSGSIESYGFAIGASLENIQYEADVSYDFEVEGEKVACMNQEGVWGIFPKDPKYRFFNWDFGDGTAVVSGKEVSHTFEKEGTYPVRIYASTGGENCDSQTEFTFEVDVIKVKADLTGASSVCPESEGFVYSLNDVQNVKSVIWEQSGGTIISKNETSITINWGMSDPNAFVRAIPVAANGCLGEVQEIRVEITDDITPVMPDGQQGICGFQEEVLTYSVPFPSEDQAYVWFVEGGQLISGQNSTQVGILWDSSAPIKTLYYEESNRISGACAGISEILELRTYDELGLDIEEIVHPACAGMSDGEIELQLIGGSGDFEFVWSHDPELNKPVALSLLAGNYAVTVTDLLGCGVKNLEIELVDPDPLELGKSTSVPATCSDSADGLFMVEVRGGSPPYILEGNESVWDGKVLKVSDLSQGGYTYTLVDSKGCSISFEAVVTGPELLSLDFEEDNPGCPGSMDGVLRAVPSGGTPPYSYEWGNGMMTQTIDKLPPGEVFVRVIDANGCEISGMGKVSEAKPQVRMPSGFDPNKGLYQPVFNCRISYELFVFDRWGELIHSGNIGWDGFFEGKPMAAGVYSFLIRYDYPLGNGSESEEMRGSFTLVN